ncbi:MAG TPA: DUF4058 family protein [Gemmataceae bacterium]|nr:DUF4058 family protein [Gemmataceae bacterium]
MPLLDHFHPPLRSVRHWESFHARWAGALADLLNLQLLPKDYVAEVHVNMGGRFEVDIGTFETQQQADAVDGGAGGGVAVAPAEVWAPPAPTLAMPAVFPPTIELLVVNQEGGPNIVAAVELVSPGNKDRPETRRAFAAKCVSYLQEGIGLIVVDVVTERRANLHNELVRLMQTGNEFLMPTESDLYAVAYRPVRRENVEKIDIWPTALALGKPLPVLPLSLAGKLCLPLDLEAAYMDTCRVSRIRVSA